MSVYAFTQVLTASHHSTDSPARLCIQVPCDCWGGLITDTEGPHTYLHWLHCTACSLSYQPMTHIQSQISSYCAYSVTSSCSNNVLLHVFKYIVSVVYCQHSRVRGQHCCITNAWLCNPSLSHLQALGRRRKCTTTVCCITAVELSHTLNRSLHHTVRSIHNRKGSNHFLTILRSFKFAILDLHNKPKIRLINRFDSVFTVPQVYSTAQQTVKTKRASRESLYKQQQSSSTHSTSCH